MQSFLDIILTGLIGLTGFIIFYFIKDGQTHERPVLLGVSNGETKDYDTFLSLEVTEQGTYPIIIELYSEEDLLASTISNVTI